MTTSIKTHLPLMPPQRQDGSNVEQEREAEGKAAERVVSPDTLARAKEDAGTYLSAIIARRSLAR